MRFIIYGAGGIGGTIGGRLAMAGEDVVLICRGEHLAAIRANGLLLRTPDGDHRIPVPAVAHPSEVDWRAGDIVFLCMKTQDSESALRDLEHAAGPEIPVFCAQNGVENERLASRRFRNVYATLVALPATFLVPGEVIASAAPLSGCLHSGCYPSGVDATCEAVCAVLSRSHFHCEPSADALQLKYRKLLLNLGNGVEVIVGQNAWGAPGPLGEFVDELRREAAACYAAAGIGATGQEEYVERVTRHYRAQPVGGEARNGSSTLQSVLRGHDTTEVDFLNGEIALLSRLTGVPAPLNCAVRELATKMAREHQAPGSLSLEDVRRAGASLAGAR